MPEQRVQPGLGSHRPRLPLRDPDGAATDAGVLWRERVATAVGLGAFLYPLFWTLGACKTPEIGAHEAKESLELLAQAGAGLFFLGTRDGRLLCVNLGDEKITGWSQWGGNAGRSGPSGLAPSSHQLARIP